MTFLANTINELSRLSERRVCVKFKYEMLITSINLSNYRKYRKSF